MNKGSSTHAVSRRQFMAALGADLAYPPEYRDVNPALWGSAHQRPLEKLVG